MPAIARPTKPLAKVNVYEKQKDGSCKIEVCFLPDLVKVFGAEAESKAVLGLDASRSMYDMYGAQTGPFPDPNKPNCVQLVARKLGDILSGGTKSGKATAFYWAMNAAGDGTKVIGELDAAGWSNVKISGPQRTAEWGRGTKLLPALKLVVDQIHQGSDFTMAVIITDGIIEDEKDCMDYCMKVGAGLAGGKVKPLKMVLVGVGQEVDEDQLSRLDDMFEGTNLEGKVDLWSTGTVASMQDESDIYGVLFGELMDADTEIARSGRVETRSGKELISWTDGMPGKFS
ncbi:MAG: hypothetical protein FJY85_24635, partial [Deltaproteobacteria bacterium]|nr:hypothetical protein [Deltaproteobacteria bacterium]